MQALNPNSNNKNSQKYTPNSNLCVQNRISEYLDHTFCEKCDLDTRNMPPDYQLALLPTTLKGQRRVLKLLSHLSKPIEPHRFVTAAARAIAKFSQVSKGEVAA